jgi:hypothetical protein
MKKIDWQLVAGQVRELYPTVMQIASYSRDRWLIVFEAEADNFLSTFHPLVKLIDKHKLSVPLIVSKQFIQSSLDSYPLEFLDIKTDYTNLYQTEDVIETLQFDKNDIRLQIERELRGKWLLTRLVALEHKQKPKYLFSVLNESFQALIPVFKGFSFLYGNTVPKTAEGLLESLEEILHTDLKVLKYIAGQKKAPSDTLVNSLFADYLRFLNLCTDNIDNWTQA